MKPPGIGVQYRIATIADVPSMAQSRLSDPTATSIDSRTAAYLEGKHHPQHALPPRIGYVAVVADTTAGYIAGHLTQRFDCDGELQYLFVAGPYRRTGVATELFRLLARWFVEQEAESVCVNVAPDNIGARALYTRLGARPLKRYWMVWDPIDGG